MESRVSISLKRSTRETLSVWERASVRTMKSKSAAVNRARQFALTIGNAECAMEARMASKIIALLCANGNRHPARQIKTESHIRNHMLRIAPERVLRLRLLSTRYRRAVLYRRGNDAPSACSSQSFTQFRGEPGDSEAPS